MGKVQIAEVKPERLVNAGLLVNLRTRTSRWVEGPNPALKVRGYCHFRWRLGSGRSVMKHMGPTTRSGNTWSQFVHEVGLGVAIRVMPVPSVNSPPQREPQLIPAGKLMTVVLLELPVFTTNNSVDIGEGTTR